MRYSSKYRCLGDPHEELLGCSFFKTHIDIMKKFGHISPGSVWKHDDCYFIIEGAYFEEQELVPLKGRQLKALAKRFKMLEYDL
jgi:hypothetical protein